MRPVGWNVDGKVACWYPVAVLALTVSKTSSSSATAEFFCGN